LVLDQSRTLKLTSKHRHHHHTLKTFKEVPGKLEA
jgi:hypothetical protein